MSVHKSKVTKQLKDRKGHFAQIPNELFVAKISVNARIVWMYLMSEGPRWDSSVANIARNIKISRSTATRAVKELEEHNMISKVQTKSGTDFTIYASSDWQVEWINETPRCLTMDDSADDSKTSVPLTNVDTTVDSTEGKPLTKFDARVDQSVGGIQDSNTNTSNTINTADRERSGFRKVREIEIQDLENEFSKFSESLSSSLS